MSGSERAPLELAVVLPTYNERGNVRAVIARLEAAVAQALADGVKGADLGGNAGTAEVGEAVLARL